MRKTFFLGLVLLIAVGCTANKEAKNAPITLPEAKAKVNASEPHWKVYNTPGEVTWFVNFDWFNTDSGNDLLTQEIERRTGTKITFLKGDEDRFNQMIASGQLPDIITTTAGATQFSASADRWAVPLNQLADAYDPYFYQVTEPDTIAWYTNEKGNIYGYPSFSNSAKHYFEEDWLMAGSAFVVRNDIYQAIGRPNMRTPEGFLQGLRDAKRYDPTIIPLTGTNLADGGSFGDTLMDFLAIPKVVDYKRNERIYDEEYLRWMNTLRQAYQEGLIVDDEFAIKGEQFEENIAQGAYFGIFVDGVAQRSGSLTHNYNRNQNQRYIAIDGPSNRNGDAPRLSQSGIGGWTQTYVTTQAKDKERAISLMTFLLSDEGQALMAFGVEGKSFYIDDDGYYHLLPEVAELRISDNDKFKRDYRIGELWMLMHESFERKNANNVMPSMQQIHNWSRGKAYPSFLLENTEPPARSKEDRIRVMYDTERKTLIVNMIRAKSEQEMLALVQQFKDNIQKMGFAETEAIINEKIAQNAQRLGM